MREKLDPVFVFIIVYTILSFVYLELKRGVAAMPSKGGLAIAVPYPTVIYRGWIGGIVSIDKNH